MPLIDKIFINKLFIFRVVKIIYGHILFKSLRLFIDSFTEIQVKYEKRPLGWIRPCQ